MYKVEDIFHKVHPYYDHMNDIMSFGIHRLWRKKCIDMIPKKDYRIILDLGCGHGHMTKLLIKEYPSIKNKIFILLDITENFLKQGKQNFLKEHIHQNEFLFLRGTSTNIPIKGEKIDLIICSFTLRNTSVINTLQEIHRVLSPNGILINMDFSHPQSLIARKLFYAYLRVYVSNIGIIFKDRASYKYLVDSIKKFPSAEKLNFLMQRCGFCRIETKSLSKGICAIHVAHKT